ncbi:insulinase family protein [Streptomyces mobaraensis NBRC 13819 = DSM 40847]|uniref:Peptidase M16 domain protein n=1 Tax=Streptomyces mobaraensis (strain ATCC 29032 / DSM 40847 / JCM 4168 / NBRC 13819 / NCIMB 11159 / IPCR 16-22) TaxID=1223523 RepID=M3BQN0_STRM1|nr:pitrilysin family protein [Streptomyces mobaraensis]EMF02020.1 Peptidase M16 domain protein [Streptomyces mobaraensis NBRC 13819 = DSM 40847]QTT76384.1 insulinase family protein [Streptomyces mobaraensis NBRC 13819 = DSM 40847]
MASGFERLKLDNGLRVVLDPYDAHGLVGVAVHYDVGFRTEPRDLNGIAHLCEHVLWDGVPKAQVNHILQSGGMLNATTQADHTDYYGVLPKAEVGALLRLEAQRMSVEETSPAVMRREVQIVKDEIRANIDGQPFGGFPWMWISEIAFNAPENTHNGYGVDRVETLTPQQLDHFLQKFYAPANAVLTVSGSFDQASIADQIHEAFGAISKRFERSEDSPVADPPLAEDRFLRRSDPHAPHPATAIAFRAPEAARPTRELLAAVVLADVLVDDPLGRLDRRLCPTTGVTDLGTYIGLFGNPFDGRAPLPWIIEALHAETITPQQLVTEIRDELATIARTGPSQDEVARTARRLASQMWRSQDQPLGRLLLVGSMELLHGAAEAVQELPLQILTVTPEEVGAVAPFLAQQHVAVLSLEAAQ